jgi:hypothetical protein
VDFTFSDEGQTISHLSGKIHNHQPGLLCSNPGARGGQVRRFIAGKTCQVQDLRLEPIAQLGIVADQQNSFLQHAYLSTQLIIA